MAYFSLRFSFWIGLAHLFGSAHVGADQLEKEGNDRAVYVIVRVPGRVITNVDLATFYNKVAHLRTSEEEALIELILRYLAIWHTRDLDVRKTRSLEIETAVNQQLAYYREIGYPEPQINYMRKQIKDEMVDRITVEEFLRKEVFRVSYVSPKEVNEYYKETCMGESLQVPKQHRLVKVYYSLEKGDLDKPAEWDVAFFAPLCRAVNHMKGTFSLKKLDKLITKLYWEKGKKLVVSPIFSRSGTPYLTSNDFDPKWKEVFALPNSDWHAGLCSTPYRKHAHDGKKVVELLCVLEVIPAHSMNLIQDYVTIENWLLREQQANAVKAWLKAHAHEVVIEEPKYKKVIENL